MEIRKRINRLYKEIEFIQTYSVTNFILNPKIQCLQLEIDGLQRECPHLFIDHRCTYCDLEEGDLDGK